MAIQGLSRCATMLTDVDPHELRTISVAVARETLAGVAEPSSTD